MTSAAAASAWLSPAGRRRRRRRRSPARGDVPVRQRRRLDVGPRDHLRVPRAHVRHLLSGRHARDHRRREVSAAGERRPRRGPPPDGEPTPAPPAPRARSIDVERHLGALARLHEAMRAGTAPPPEVVDTLASLDGDDGLSLHDFLHDDRVFAELCAEYDAHQPETSFIDYFWTLRTMHVPLFKLASIARSLPRFRALHAVSTGYAGLLGALVHRRTQAPFILTEHGIYTKERTIDLAHAAWIKDEPASGSRQRVRQPAPALDPLLRGAGADGLRRRGPDHLALRRATAPARSPTARRPSAPASSRTASTCTVRGAAARRPARAAAACVGLIGRVVPIKDIKTFIRAMREVWRAARRRGVDRRSRGRGQPLRPGMPGAGGSAGPGRRRALSRLPAGGGDLAPSSASRC